MRIPKKNKTKNKHKIYKNHGDVGSKILWVLLTHQTQFKIHLQSKQSLKSARLGILNGGMFCEIYGPHLYNPRVFLLILWPFFGGGGGILNPQSPIFSKPFVLISRVVFPSKRVKQKSIQITCEITTGLELAFYALLFWGVSGSFAALWILEPF